MKKINLKKVAVAIAGPSVIVLGMGLVSPVQSETFEVRFSEMENSSSTYGRDLYTCEGTYGNCLPTFVCCEEEID